MSGAPPEEIRAGDIIEDRWEVFGVASGAMGRVLLVRDLDLGRLPLAIKELLPGRANSRVALELFRRESRVWLDLGWHPNIVTGFYALPIRDRHGFFMEFVDGAALDVVLLRDGPLPLHRTLDFAIQLAGGMEYVHHRNVIHRDLKPANCLVEADDTLRITDFGLGAVVDANAAPDTLERLRAGTPMYMAPEQWSSLADAAPPADVYAFGVILYEMLSGVRPFDVDPSARKAYAIRASGELRNMLMAASPVAEVVLELLHREVEPLPVSDRGVAVPAPVANLVMRCLRKAARERPTFNVLCRMLQDLYEVYCGKFHREPPKRSEGAVVGANNRAVSYYTMAEVATARAILDNALEEHPGALHLELNRIVIDLREGLLDPFAAAIRVRELKRIHGKAFSAVTAAVSLEALVRRYSLTHSNPVVACAYSPRGDHLAAACGDGTISVWDMRFGDRLVTCEGHKKRCNALSWNGEGTQLLSGGWDQEARLWETTSSQCIFVLRGHRSRITSCTVDESRNELVTASEDGTVITWCATTGARRTTRQFEGGILQMTWMDGGPLAIARADGLVVQYSTGVERVQGTTGHLALCPGTSKFATGEGRTVSIVDEAGMRRTESVDAGAEISAIGWRSDRSAILAATVSGDIYEIQAGGLVGLSAGFGQPISAVADAPTGKWLAATLPHGVIGTAARPTVERLRSELAVLRPVTARESAHRGAALEAAIRQVEAGGALAAGEIESLRRAAGQEHNIHVSRRVARASQRLGRREGVPELWRAWRAEMQSSITALAISNDARVMAVGTSSGRVAILDAASGRGAAELGLAGGERLTDLAFVGDGRQDIVVLADGRPAIGRWQHGQFVELGRPDRPKYEWMSVCPSGECFAAVAARQLTVWDAGTHEELATILPPMSSAPWVGGGFIARDVLLLVHATGRAARYCPRSSRFLPDVSAKLGNVDSARVVRSVLVTRTEAHIADLWHTATWGHLSACEGRRYLDAPVAVTRDGELFAIGSHERTHPMFHLHLAVDGSRTVSMPVDDSPVTALTFDADDVALVAGTANGILEMWIVESRWGSRA